MSFWKIVWGDVDDLSGRGEWMPRQVTVSLGVFLNYSLDRYVPNGVRDSGYCLFAGVREPLGSASDVSPGHPSERSTPMSNTGKIVALRSNAVEL